MKRWYVVVGIIIVGLASWWLIAESKEGGVVSPRGKVIKSELPLTKYSFERLVERDDQESEIEVGEEGETFSYQTEGKRVTGAITIPETVMPESGWPVVVMIRGYADKETYYTGYGTKSGAQYYSGQGYAVLAPDFLGYGGSDAEDEDSLGARVRRPVEVLDLVASLSSLEYLDTNRVYLWGHSNGGQIALSVVEVLGKREPRGRTPRVRGVTLWAPVTRPFPYSILYYTYDWDDRGRELRRAIAEWEELYVADEYSIERYWDWITTPLQIHQGTADEAVPVSWSDEAVAIWEELEKDVTYYRYPGADHNMSPSWNTVVTRDVEWFAGL